MSSSSYRPFSSPITPATLPHLFAHQTARFGGWRMEDAPDWGAVFPDQTPDQVKAALEAAAASSDPNPWAQTFADQKPEDVKKALEESRKWESRAKGNKEKAEQLDALTKLITGQDDDDKPDPQKLASDLTAAQRETHATKVENAVLKAAVLEGAHPVRLTDSRSFMADALKLDPSAADFKTQMATAIKAAVDDDPTLKVVAGPRPARQQGQTRTPGDRRGGSVAEVMEERRAARAAKN